MKSTTHDALLCLLLHQQVRLMDASLNLITLPKEHNEVLTVAREMAKDGIKVTPEAVSLHKLGGERRAMLVAGLLERQPPKAPLRMLVDAIRKENLREELGVICRRYHDQSEEPDTDPHDSLMAMQAELIKMNRGRTDSALKPGGDLSGVEQRISWLQKNPGKLRGVQTGFPTLDRTINGLQPGYYIFGGRASTGKSAILGNIIRQVCQNSGRVGLWSWESSADDYRERILSSMAFVNLMAFSERELAMAEIASLSKAQRAMQKWDWFINDNNNSTIDDLESQATMLHMEKPLTMIAVDYLQYIKMRGRVNRFERVSEISNRLANLSKRLKVPTVVLAQLHRVDGRFVKELGKTVTPRPDIMNLRDSGDIEQDADFIGLLDRDIQERPEEAMLIIGKNRNGPTGRDIRLRFRKEITLFTEA